MTATYAKIHLPARATQARGFSFRRGQRATYNRIPLYAKPLVYRVPALRDPGRHVDRPMYKGFCVMKPTQKNYDVAAWEVLSRQIMRRDGYRCQAACGCTVPLSVHHIIPRDVGGSDDPANLITLCVQCHNEIEQTAIRTAAEVRAYAPRWHATVSWYPTERRRSTPTPATHSIKRKAQRTQPSTNRNAGYSLKLCFSCRRWFGTYSRRQRYCAECKREHEPKRFYF